MKHHDFKKIEDTLSLMAQRKNDHIQICKTKPVESQGEPFSNVHFTPEALPEMNFDDLDLSQNFLGQVFSMPMLITGMTGGVTHGQEINEALALASQKFNIPMGLGSQKMMIKDPSLKPLFDVKKKAPKLFLIGNMGAVSLNYGISIDDIKRLVDTLELNAFAIHLNALQECIQPEGERNFNQLLPKIEALVAALPVPVMIKEVGSGMSSSTCKKLVEIGVKAIDVGGKGGTSWSAIEGYRSDEEGARLGELFRNWGLSTDQALASCVHAKQQIKGNVELVATGGMRNGLQIAKAVALGATMVGVGLPLFKAAVEPPKGLNAQEAIERELAFFRKSLLVTLFCCGAQSLSDLKTRLLTQP
jgi:isopentenyl-diphosphate delta-isomerase